MVPEHSNRIGLILRDMGILTLVDVARILLEQNRSSKQFGAIAIDWGLASTEQVTEAWARQLSTDQRHVDLDAFKPQPEALEAISSAQARQLRALPLRRWGDHLIVAIVSMPLDGQILEAIAKTSGHRYVYPCFCAPAQLTRALDQYYPSAQACEVVHAS